MDPPPIGVGSSQNSNITYDSQSYQVMEVLSDESNDDPFWQMMRDNSSATS